VQNFNDHFNAFSGSKWVDRLYEGDQPLNFCEVLALETAGVCGYSNVRLFADIFIA